ncbi:MAG: RagB/SusD family nutrient uptake outer membrane protein [Bacteroidales bacterium]|nr:RagB/SusD family nutrient uptake outer membrane protein [Bacteroidales bacterium]
MRTRIFKYIFIVSTILALSGCGKEFLNRVPESTLTVESFYKSPEQLRQATAGLYSVVWFQYNDKAAIGMGDGLGGNILGPWTTNLSLFYQFNVTPLNTDLSNAWKAFYRVVAQSNFTIANINKYAENVTQDEINAAIAEARFMRATAYFYLVRLWGPVMIIENHNELIENFQVPLAPVEDVYRFIIEDFQFAVDNLPVSDEPGRVTSWSAKGMLAKVYLAYSGYNQNGSRDTQMLAKAAELSGDVCKNSGLELFNDYEGLFFLKNENNQESLFSLQWVELGAWGSQNTFQAYYAYSSDITGVGDGWGGGNGPSYDLIREFLSDPADTLRLHATCFTYGDYYPEIKKKNGGITFELANPKIKKYVIGTPEDNDGNVAIMNASINTYMLRLADVYLTYAEAVLGNNFSTNNPDALYYFNLVRERAGLEPKASIDFEDVFHERRMEFAIESQLWYDIVRWYYYEPQEALDYINSQKRDYDFTFDDNGLVLGDPFSEVTATAEDIFLPYPENDVIQNPELVEDPVPYNFD